MRNKVIAFALGFAVVFSMLMVMSPANAAPYEIRTVTTNKFLGEHQAGNPEVDTRGKMWFRVYSDRIVAYKVSSSYNTVRDVACGSRGKFQGTRLDWSFKDGRKVSLKVPCREDGRHVVSKPINLTFYAPRPCAVVPCPPLAQVKAKHVARYWLTSDAEKSTSWRVVS